MLRWPHIAGAVLGVVSGAWLLALRGGNGEQCEPGPVVSECDGHFRELVIHYEASAEGISLPVYCQFLPALEADVTVRVVCPSVAVYREFCARIGQVRCALVPVITNHPITTWSRDRWVPLSPARAGKRPTLLYPRGETAVELWPQRAGDERVAREVVAASGGRLLARRSSLSFDGGDFLADSENVFVIPRVVQQNLQQTTADRQLLLTQLSAQLKRRVILLEKAPDHHAGMFMASVGNRTMLVGDPSLGSSFAGLATSDPLTNPNASGPTLPADADCSASTQALFDAVARQCQAVGYNVVRIPTLLAPDGRTYFTYVNALIDRQADRRIVYLPVYRGAEKLNHVAQACWESLGYIVRPIDCTSTYRHFGCLHCLVSVLQRD